jgi:hypothetical protein
MNKRHEMTLMGPAESGAEEWFCSICGRLMLMRWEPEFETLVLKYGDDTAVHYGAKGALRLDGLVVD